MKFKLFDRVKVIEFDSELGSFLRGGAGIIKNFKTDLVLIGNALTEIISYEVEFLDYSTFEEKNTSEIWVPEKDLKHVEY